MKDGGGGHDPRNELALVRTDLANERTLLAYLRTALITAGSGITLIKFFSDIPIATTVGWSFVGVGPTVAIFGIVRFALLRRRLHRPNQIP